MRDTQAMKNSLLQQAGISEECYSQAEDYALTRGISLEDALLFLEFVDFEGLGRCLATFYGKPYFPLLVKPPSRKALALVPLDAAERLQVFPVGLDAKQQLVVFSVSDPEAPGLEEELGVLVPGRFRPTLAVAAAAEIRQAIDVHYRGNPYARPTRIQVPEDFTILPAQDGDGDVFPPGAGEAGPDLAIVLLEPDPKRASAIRTLLLAEGCSKVSWALSPLEASKALRAMEADLLLVNGAVFRPRGEWLQAMEGMSPSQHISFYDVGPLLLGQEHPYQRMGRALIEMTACLVRRILRDDLAELRDTFDRVKLCKLLAVRLGLPRRQVDAAVLAAWLSSPRLSEEIAGQVDTPYGLQEILSPPEAVDSGLRVEATLLELVRRYQELVSGSGKARGGTAWVRKELRKKLPRGAGDAMVETLLRIVREEEFLDRLGQQSPKILIVDPEISERSPLALRLGNEGWQVVTATSAHQAFQACSGEGADLVLTELELGEPDGLELCRLLKSHRESAAVPIVFLTSGEGQRLHAECLEAGADDFMNKPPDMDVLCLKIKRLLSYRQNREPSRGVRGSLRELSTGDFLQSLSAGEKSVEVQIRRDGEQARIFMRSGRVVHCECGVLGGEEAFYSVVRWEEGEFEILPCSRFPEQSIHAPLESLLIEGFRRVDEALAREKGEE